ncbi:MAG: hypothetical protein WDM85_10200 [Caulobacteraceae bacterium]
MSRFLAGLIAALALSFAAGPALAAPQSAWDHVARVVVMGDLHGDYGKFHDMLTEAGLIDVRDNWPRREDAPGAGRRRARPRARHPQDPRPADQA